MVGIYSLYTLGLGSGGPRYIWTMPVVVGCMMLVALVFGELASEYPLSGALYQYGKYSVGPRYGWFIGWIYGFALLATVASVDSGAVGYVTSLSNIWFRTQLRPDDHATIFVIAGGIIVLSAILNSIGAKILGRVARYGVYVETIGTFGVFLALAAFGFHQHLGFIFTSQHVEYARSNPLGLNFGGNWWTAAALVAVLANVYIFYGFESAGDISEETVEAQRQVPKAMRNALLYGGIASFVLVLGLVACDARGGHRRRRQRRHQHAVRDAAGLAAGLLPRARHRRVLQLRHGRAGRRRTRRLRARSRRGLPFSDWMQAHLAASSHAGQRDPDGNGRPVSLLAARADQSEQAGSPARGSIIRRNVNALYALVSFATSGIYLAFLLTVLARSSRARGWKPSGVFTLGRWGVPVTVGGRDLLALMLLEHRLAEPARAAAPSSTMAGSRCW